MEQNVKCRYHKDRVRPLVHPALEDITVEGILHALSDPVRADIYADMAASSCSQNCASFQKISARAIPKSTLSQHFRALREAGLIRSERQGVEMQNTSRCAEIESRFPGLLAAILKAYEFQAQVQAKDKSLRTSRRKLRGVLR